VNIQTLNALEEHEARQAFERCCGARAWVEAMLAARPFADRGALLEASDGASAALSRIDWLEAFSHHPRIGDVASLRERFVATAAWAGDEQQGASGTSEATLQALARGNRAYEERFGYIFIVCATGKSADEMLSILESRLPNDPDRELRVAAAEQARITRLRIDKLLEDS
jgi:2-oxo-4-hydroxy-4-carboxy-5-ureidoimidazoline decarboxylase